MRICVDLTKLNETVMREKITYHPSTKRVVIWREQLCSHGWMPTPVLANSPGAIIPGTHDLLHSLWKILLSTFAIWDNISHRTLPKEDAKVLEDLPGVLSMMDDIIIFGYSSEERDARVSAVFRRLEDNGVAFNSGEVRVCYVKHNIPRSRWLTGSGQIRQRCEPSSRCINRKTLATYDSSSAWRTKWANFIPNMSTVTQPLRDVLQKKNQWT